jgi:hypothetical protein
MEFNNITLKNIPVNKCNPNLKIKLNLDIPEKYNEIKPNITKIEIKQINIINNNSQMRSFSDKFFVESSMTKI